MSRSYSPPNSRPGWAAYQAQGLTIGSWRAQVTFDDPNPLPSGTDFVNDHDVLAPRQLRDNTRSSRKEPVMSRVSSAGKAIGI